MYSGVFATYIGYIGLHWFIYWSCKETINAFSLQSTPYKYLVQIHNIDPTEQARLLEKPNRTHSINTHIRSNYSANWCSLEPLNQLATT